MQKRYAILDKNNLVLNVTLWDGVSTWSSLAGTTLAQVPDNSPVGTGGIYDPKSKAYTAPILPTIPPTLVEKLTQALINKKLITASDVSAVTTATISQALL